MIGYTLAARLFDYFVELFAKNRNVVPCLVLGFTSDTARIFCAVQLVRGGKIIANKFELIIKQRNNSILVLFQTVF